MLTEHWQEWVCFCFLTLCGFILRLFHSTSWPGKLQAGAADRQGFLCPAQGSPRTEPHWFVWGPVAIPDQPPEQRGWSNWSSLDPVLIPEPVTMAKGLRSLVIVAILTDGTLHEVLSMSLVSREIDHLFQCRSVFWFLTISMYFTCRCFYLNGFRSLL